jgi:hypothetical protein
MTALITSKPEQPVSDPDTSRIEYGTLSLVSAVFPWLIAIYFWWLAGKTGSSLAVVLGLLFCLAGPPMAVVFGHLGRRRSQIRRGVALAGLVLGYLQIILLLIILGYLPLLVLAFSAG